MSEQESRMTSDADKAFAQYADEKIATKRAEDMRAVQDAIFGESVTGETEDDAKRVEEGLEYYRHLEGLSKRGDNYENDVYEDRLKDKAYIEGFQTEALLEDSIRGIEEQISKDVRFKKLVMIAKEIASIRNEINTGSDREDKLVPRLADKLQNLHELVEWYRNVDDLDSDVLDYIVAEAGQSASNEPKDTELQPSDVVSPETGTGKALTTGEVAQVIDAKDLEARDFLAGVDDKDKILGDEPAANPIAPEASHPPTIEEQIAANDGLKELLARAYALSERLGSRGGGDRRAARTEENAIHDELVKLESLPDADPRIVNYISDIAFTPRITEPTGEVVSEPATPETAHVLTVEERIAADEAYPKLLAAAQEIARLRAAGASEAECTEWRGQLLADLQSYRDTAEDADIEAYILSIADTKPDQKATTTTSGTGESNPADPKPITGEAVSVVRQLSKEEIDKRIEGFEVRINDHVGLTDLFKKANRLAELRSENKAGSDEYKDIEKNWESEFDEAVNWFTVHVGDVDDEDKVVFDYIYSKAMGYSVLPESITTITEKNTEKPIEVQVRVQRLGELADEVELLQRKAAAFKEDEGAEEKEALAQKENSLRERIAQWSTPEFNARNPGALESISNRAFGTSLPEAVSTGELSFAEKTAEFEELRDAEVDLSKSSRVEDLKTIHREFVDAFKPDADKKAAARDKRLEDLKSTLMKRPGESEEAYERSMKRTARSKLLTRLALSKAMAKPTPRSNTRR